MNIDPAPYTLGSEEGEAFWFFGGLVTVKASAQQSGGRFALTDQLFPGGMATPLHSQPEDDESFYVLEGEVTFYLEDGQPIPASAGSFVHVPAGVAHAFQVDSETARILNFHYCPTPTLLPSYERSGADTDHSAGSTAWHGEDHDCGTRVRGRDTRPTAGCAGLKLA